MSVALAIKITVHSIAWWWSYGIHVGLCMQVEWVGVIGASLVCVILRDSIDAVCDEVSAMIGRRE